MTSWFVSFMREHKEELSGMTAGLERLVQGFKELAT